MQNPFEMDATETSGAISSIKKKVRKGQTVETVETVVIYDQLTVTRDRQRTGGPWEQYIGGEGGVEEENKS